MDFGMLKRAKVGRDVCGDDYLVLPEEHRVVAAVSDGLGSGEKAYQSSQLAIQGVADYSSFALTDILTYCHYAILTNSGVGAMIAILRLNTREHSLEFAGVGNIRFLAHSRETIQPIVRYGYLGVRLPRLQSYRFSYAPGDVFALHTDGISSRFHLHNYLRDLEQGAQTLADRVLEELGKDHDDATIVVIKT